MSDRPWPTPRDLSLLSLWLARPSPPVVARAALVAAQSIRDLPPPSDADRCRAAELCSHLGRWRRSTAAAALVTFWDAAYPALLRQIARPPLALFATGDLQCAGVRTVAIVGARAASLAARAFTAELAGDLARCGVVVASGMARGIDAAAHRGALRAGGRTIAVLGCGPDVCYPPEHAALAARIVAQGCLLTELPPGAQPLAWHFPRRNRILAGIVAGVVVVQAEPKSGALVTARHAIDENRDVMAVPGDVQDPRSSGPHALLRDGAALVDGARAVLETLRWQPAGPGPAGDAALLLAAVGTPGVHADGLCARLGWDPARVQRAAAGLELAGLLERTAAGLWVRPAR
jgi:DNA processing protein